MEASKETYKHLAERHENDQPIPTAPNYEDSHHNEEDENRWEIEQISRSQERMSIWTKLRKSFSRYKPMNEEIENSRSEINNVIPVSSQNLPPPYSAVAPSNQCLDQIFGDLSNRNRFFRNFLLLLTAQLSWLTALAAVFDYSPHIRRIFRKTFADKIFLNSIIGFPLGILFIIIFLSRSIRRKYPFASFLVLSSCLSSLLCFLMAFESDNDLMVFELAIMSGTFGSAGLMNTIIRRFSLRKRLEVIYFPILSTALQNLQPILLKQSLAKTWHKNLAFLGITSYLAINMGSIMNDQKLALKQNEVPFAITQSFMNFDAAGSFRNLFRRQRNTSNFQRI